MQDNSHSYIVTEKLISAVVPSWLQKFEDPRLLLEVIIPIWHVYVVMCSSQSVEVIMYASTDHGEGTT